MLGRHCCTGFSLVLASGGYTLVVEGRPLSFQWFLLLWSTDSRHVGFSICSLGLWNTGSIVGVQGLSCPTTCGILPDQGLNPYLLHWQVNSFPLSYQESLKKGSILSAFLLLFHC